MSKSERISSKFISLYKWFFEQNDKNVIVKFKMPPSFKSDNIQINLQENQTIEVFIEGELPFLKGTLFMPIKKYEKSVLDNFFILTLTKNNPTEWKFLIKSVSQKDLKADPKSCFLLGIDQKDNFPNEPISPLLSLSVTYHFPAACLYLGNYFLQQGNKDFALENYKLVADEYNDPTSNLQTGIVLLQLRRDTEAVDYLQRASDSGLIAATTILKDIENGNQQKYLNEEENANLNANISLPIALIGEAAAETSTIAGAALETTALETIAAETAAQTMELESNAEKAAKAIETAAVEKVIQGTEAIANTAAATAAAGLIIENIVDRNAEIEIGAAETAAAEETALIGAAAEETAATETALNGETAAETALAGMAAAATEAAVIEGIAEEAAAQAALAGTVAEEAAVIEGIAEETVAQAHPIQNINNNSGTTNMTIAISCLAVGVSLAVLLFLSKRRKH